MEPNYNLADLDKAEPMRLSRHGGRLYYQCENGGIYSVMEGQMFDAWKADTSMTYAGTTIVDDVPTGAVPFEIGTGPAGSGDLEPGMLVSQLGPMDEAIEQWATYCDEHAANRGKPPPSGPRVKVPRRRVGVEPNMAAMA